MLFGILCALPTLLAVWFAPALVVFQDCGARQALATSLRAAVANWRPLLVYAVLLFFYGAVLPGMAIALIAVVAPQQFAPYVIAATVVPYIFLFVAAQAISDYIAYRDVFHHDEVHAMPGTNAGTPTAE
jgi:cyanate permease